MRALRARIGLRDMWKREPTAAEVDGYTQLNLGDQMTYGQISAAFQSGDEVRQRLLPSHSAVIDRSAIF